MKLLLRAVLLCAVFLCLNGCAAPASETTAAPDVTAEPTIEPTVEPTQAPTVEPTLEPTPEPTPEPEPVPYRISESMGLDAAEVFAKTDEKYAFITIDDGPTENTPLLLEVLAEYDVPATFFIVGTEAEKHPENLRLIYEAGHSLASHGYSHEYAKIYADADAFYEDLTKCDEVITNILGEDAYTPRVYRYPGGSGVYGGKYGVAKKEYSRILQENGYVSVDWNTLNGDSEGLGGDPEACKLRFEETFADVSHSRNVVVLLHDLRGDKLGTVESLGHIIETLRDEGYTLIAMK